MTNEQAEAWNPALEIGNRPMEVTEEVLLEGRDRYVQGAVEVFDLTDEAQRAISVKWHDHGWARCLKTGSTTERKPGAVVLEPHPVSTSLSE